MLERRKHARSGVAPLVPLHPSLRRKPESDGLSAIASLQRMPALARLTITTANSRPRKRLANKASVMSLGNAADCRNINAAGAGLSSCE
jgi:hypothetical protein